MQDITVNVRVSFDPDTTNLIKSFINACISLGHAPEEPYQEPSPYPEVKAEPKPEEPSKEEPKPEEPTVSEADLKNLVIRLAAAGKKEIAKGIIKAYGATVSEVANGPHAADAYAKLKEVEQDA